MDKKSSLESLMAHPVAPLVGGALIVASYLTDEPQPPMIPDGLPDATASEWVMIYQQNQQRFQRRMGIYNDLGMALLGVASAQTILDALPKRSVAISNALQDPAIANLIRQQRGAM